MNKRTVPKIKPYRKVLQANSILIFVCTLLLSISSACLLQGKNANQEARHASIIQTELWPTSFDYVQLFDRNRWLVAESDRVLKTENGGRTWTQTYSLLPSSGDNQIQGLSFIDDRVGFLVVSGNVLRTENGGKNWASVGVIKSGTERVSIQNCRFIDAVHGWAVGAVWREGWVNDPKTPRYVGIAFATQDGGQTWQRLPLDLRKGYRSEGTYWGLNDVFFKDAKTGWVVGDRGIIFSTEDGGETWSLATADDVDYQRINFLDTWFGWVTYKYGNSSWGVAATYDGGQSWKSLNESFVYGTWPVFAVFLGPEHGFAVSLRLTETKDGGRRWKLLTGSDRLGEVAYEYLGQARDGTLVALGMKNGTPTALINTDGMTWRPSN